MSGLPFAGRDGMLTDFTHRGGNSLLLGGIEVATFFIYFQKCAALCLSVTGLTSFSPPFFFFFLV